LQESFSLFQAESRSQSLGKINGQYTATPLAAWRSQQEEMPFETFARKGEFDGST
jgi:hypothetical protein